MRQRGVLNPDSREGSFVHYWAAHTHKMKPGTKVHLGNSLPFTECGLARHLGGPGGLGHTLSLKRDTVGKEQALFFSHLAHRVISAEMPCLGPQVPENQDVPHVEPGTEAKKIKLKLGCLPITKF